VQGRVRGIPMVLDHRQWALSGVSDASVHKPRTEALSNRHPGAEASKLFGPAGPSPSLHSCELSRLKTEVGRSSLEARVFSSTHAASATIWFTHLREGPCLVEGSYEGHRRSLRVEMVSATV